MEIKLIAIGKTATDYIQTGLDHYLNRLKHYVPFEIIIINDPRNVKNLTEYQRKEAEGKLLLEKFDNSDMVILLDEHGKEFTSREFSGYVEKMMGSGRKRLWFVIGGPYGFCDSVYQRSNSKISLSKMTFNHEMVRLFFTEQLYRAMTILSNEPYHHD